MRYRDFRMRFRGFRMRLRYFRMRFHDFRMRFRRFRIRFCGIRMWFSAFRMRWCEFRIWFCGIYDLKIWKWGDLKLGDRGYMKLVKLRTRMLKVDWQAFGALKTIVWIIYCHFFYFLLSTCPFYQIPDTRYKIPPMLIEDCWFVENHKILLQYSNEAI